MGISGFYTYCKKKVPSAFKNVKIIEEIENYKRENGKSPIIVVNLSTMCYHYKNRKGFFLVEHRFNKIKKNLEGFFQNMVDAGAKLVFMYKRAKFDDDEFLSKSNTEYRKSLELYQKLEKVNDSAKQRKILRESTQLPHNHLVLMAMIQSAKKFGEVHYVNSYDYKAVLVQREFIMKNNATWVIGLDTYFFLMDGDWKIFADDTLDQAKSTIDEIDKNAIAKHFELENKHLPLFAVVLGDFDSVYKCKLYSFFGSVSKFENAIRFVKDFEYPLTDESYVAIIDKIYGHKYDPKVINDLKKSVEQFMIREIETGIDSEIVDIIKDDFFNYAPEILMKKVPVFICADMIDLSNEHTKDYNELILPFIQKTAGILLKNLEDKETRKILLMTDNIKYQQHPLEPIYPEFDVPSLKTILSGEMSTFDKEKLLFFIIGEKLQSIELPCIGDDYFIDTLILLHLINKKKITVTEARCIMQTIFDTRNHTFDPQSIVYPKIFNMRATRCAFLYMHIFYEIHSCLGALGMKNFCPEFFFDGVFFQKLFALNVLGLKEEEEENNELIEGNVNAEVKISENQEDYTQTEIIDLFVKILNL
ncbi:hypothetical protein PVAND_009735 [Polypedilum vanderplanki]|uniref:Uncharacterized protein n=1 Tax=Polypedilum vanderplanki TaxID=319348 RepID=A0A9J6CDR1_POLVA|nr:hypothetical protein PVAND_009735 [Polypedilum vanderplanki]